MKEENNLQGNKKNTLIINYPVLMVGGVETYFVALMKSCIAKGYRVVWITSERFLNKIAFEGLLNNPGLEIVLTRSWMHYLDTPRISLSEDERVIMFTCEPIEYILSDKIRTEANTKQFIHYLAVPNFTGNDYYPDRYLKNKWLKKAAYRYLQKILRRVAENGCILGFAPKHLINYEDYYQIPIPDKERNLVPSFNDEEQVSFDLENAKVRLSERHERFVITSCARFVFPHKAYLLGLVDAFAKVKEKHPQAVLQLVGYGPGQQELENKIMVQPETVRRDIHLLGMLTPDALEQCYKDSHLIVGLAGAIIDGARCGIPSLVVRHYNENCETYGFLDEVPEKTLSEEPGDDIVPLIEECINMEWEAYLEHVEKGYQIVEFYKNAGDNSLIKRFEKTKKQCPGFVKSFLEELGAEILYVACTVLKRLENRNINNESEN